MLGEESSHIGSLKRQLEETFVNLEALLTPSVERALLGADSNKRDPASLFRHLRVYHAREEQARPVRDAVRRRFPKLESLELIRADICRSELMMEIEGMAHAGPSIKVGASPPCASS